MTLKNMSHGDNVYWLFTVLIMICVLVFVLSDLSSPEKSFIREVGQVCEGKKASETSGFISTEDTHPTAVFILNASNNWTNLDGTLGSGWAPISTDEVQLVLCIGKRELSWSWCPVKSQAGSQEQINFYVRNTTLYNAKTGEILWSGNLLAEDNCLGEKNQTNAAGITAFLIDFFSNPVEP